VDETESLRELAHAMSEVADSARILRVLGGGGAVARRR
jgi:hypothetical protein